MNIMLGYKLKDVEEMVEGLLNVHESLPDSRNKEEVWLAADFLIGLMEEGHVQ
jgi:hypothetical protein